MFLKLIRVFTFQRVSHALLYIAHFMKQPIIISYVDDINLNLYLHLQNIGKSCFCL